MDTQKGLTANAGLLKFHYKIHNNHNKGDFYDAIFQHYEQEGKGDKARNRKVGDGRKV